MEILFHLSIPLISTIFVTAILILFLYNANKPSYYYASSIPIIELISSLVKICPLGSANKWELLSGDYGFLRCWRQNFVMPQMKENIFLHGSAVIVNASSATIGSIIADLKKWPDWNPFNASQLIVKSFSDKKLRRDHYLEADQIISIVCKRNAIQSQTVMYRFHAYSQNKTGCILFWNVKQLEFMFFLIQPIKNNAELPQCVLTHIIGSENSNSLIFASKISQRLRNIQDLQSHSSLNTSPLLLIPDETNQSNPLFKAEANQAPAQENLFSLATSRAHKRHAKNTAFILVPFVVSNLWLCKQRREFKLGVREIESESSSKNKSQNPPKLMIPKYPLRRTASDIGAKSPSLVSPPTLSKPCGIEATKPDSQEDKTNIKVKEDSKHESSTTSEDSEAKGSSKSNNKLGVKNFLSQVKLRSLSETALNLEGGAPGSEETGQISEGSRRLKDIDESPEHKLVAMHCPDQKEMFNSSVSDFEIVEGQDIARETNEFTENRIASLMTQGNYGASELQAEVLLASQFEECLNSGNFQSCGGWMLHSRHKGLIVLGKATSSQFLQITSFLCQTELTASPKDIWKFVKCPQFRFICDETVKRVEVLEKLSSSQKIIHTYHEIGSFLRKELVDFCLLQTERVEMNKCYSCFYSIENDKCPFMKSVTRGTLRPSGWIVEEVDKNNKKSKVTYMIQMVSNPESLLLEELSTLVAQAVNNLKNYTAVKPM